MKLTNIPPFWERMSIPCKSTLGMFFLCALGCLYLYSSDVKSVTDDMGHHLLSKYFWTYPEIMLSQWQRPLYTILTAVPASLSYHAHCASSVFFSLLCSVFTIGIARHYGLGNVFLIPVIISTLPAYTDILWTCMSEAPFAAFVAFSLWVHLKGHPALAIVLAGFSPLIRPEGAIVVLVWAGYYIWTRKTMLVPLSLLGMASWIFLSWVITGDPFYSLSSSYRLNPGIRGIQWDYLLKAYDDFSGPVWFVSAIVGLIAFRGIRFDLVHGTYLSLFLFFLLIRDNLEDLPQGHFGWRFLASTAPLFSIYALKGLNTLLDGRRLWPSSSEKLLKGILLAVGFIISITAAIYVQRRNPYGSTLLVLALVANVSILTWLSSPLWTLPQRKRISVFLVILALGFTIVKVPFYRASEKDIAVQQLAQWWLSDPQNHGLRVSCALSGFYYYADLDPIYHRQKKGDLPGVPGGIVIWDSWAMERWGRIPYRLLEENGYIRRPSPIEPRTFDLRVYWRPL